MPTRLVLALAAALGAAAARGSEPLVVELPEQATARTAVVALGDVARVTGGQPADRARAAGLDVAEFRPRDAGLVLSRAAVEYRLKLAGVAARVTGADRTTITVTRRAVTADEVVAVARRELLPHLGAWADGATIELVQAIAVPLPAVPAGEAVTIAARPHSRVTGPGRVQMDVAVSAGGDRLLSLAVMMDVKAAPTVVPAGGQVPPAPAPGPVVPAGGPRPASPGTPPAAGEVLVKARQRVKIQVLSGALVVTAVGEALQDGKLGQNVSVQNVDSKKVLTARVSGPGVVDVELGGGP